MMIDMFLIFTPFVAPPSPQWYARAALIASASARGTGGFMSLLDKINANPLPFAKLLGIEFISVERDALAARMAIRPDLCTLGGIGHGGAIMSFADTLGAAAAFVNLPPDAKGTTTIESKTNFVAAAPAGATVIGRTSLVHRGRRTQVWQTLVATEDEKLVAMTVQTQMTL
jgi:1,4-dihydroxy-2-naphthoyl-CoA hydrolase